jgi:uncharacterized cupin superfamily protein
VAEQRRHPNVVNLSEVEAQSQSTGTKFGSSSRRLGAATGAQGIGCSWYEVPPGRAAFPRHYHCANEEALFVLEGEGSVRIGEDTVPVRQGDYVTFPTGPKHAHQVRNTGTAPLRYLSFSTLQAVEVVGYPDSKKIGARAAPTPEAAMKGEHWMRFVAFESSQAGYYDGEDVG